jgi:hypothetical protein
MHPVLRDTLGFWHLFLAHRLPCIHGVVFSPFSYSMGWIILIIFTPFTVWVTWWWFRQRDALTLQYYAGVGFSGP